MANELVKFEKILTLNDASNETIDTCLQLLFNLMKNTNFSKELTLEYFSLKLTHSEKNPFGKDLKLEWASLPLKEK